jgi:hypothetical protein
MEAIVALFIPIVISLGFFVVMIVMRHYDHAEKMSMIEKGMSPELSRFNFKFFAPSKYRPLRFGLVFLGSGLGIIVGSLIEHALHTNTPEFHFGGVLLFGGLGLLVAYIIQNKNEKEESNKL